MSDDPSVIDLHRDHQHRALVRYIRTVEGDVAADRSAVLALEKLAILVEHLPLTDFARNLILNWIDEAHSALLLHLWPVSRHE